MSATAVTNPVFARIDGACLHCGQAVTTAGDAYCCGGCEAVSALLRTENLGRYYDLRGSVGVPVVQSAAPNDRKWLEAAARGVESSESASRLALDIQGIHCSACVWLIEELFRRDSGGIEMLVNPTLGRLSLSVRPRFKLTAFVARIEAFGYRIGPATRLDSAASSAIVTRFGVCVALSMNAMIFAIAGYLGLTEARLHRLFDTIGLGLATTALLVGGPVFFKSALQAIRARALHLDLPIALGLSLAYAGSVRAYFAHEGVYFDTICVFTTLMLLGRYLQQRIIEKNRAQLLSDTGAGALLTRRVSPGGMPAVVACSEIQVGDELSIASGDLLPVDARLVAGAAPFSLDWINGESSPRLFGPGDVVPAGAFNAGVAALRVVAVTDFAASAVTDLLRTPMRGVGQRGVESRFLRLLAPIYVGTVLALAASAFGVWLIATHDLSRAIQVATAMLVVTCPCAFGIATPLAYELAQGHLRKRGVFVRSADFLDRATRVRKVVFDKTGTLTEGATTLSGAESIASLSAADRNVFAALAGASAHPKSVAVASILRDASPPDDVVVTERPGAGLHAQVGGHDYRLGSPNYAGRFGECDVTFAIDGLTVAGVATGERLRSDAVREVAALRGAGYEVWILSGDEHDRTGELGARVGLAADHCIGGCTAEQKADWLVTHDSSDTLMIGDGINDLIAVSRAFCSGTPAVDRPFVASRADFYFVSPGLAPVRAALVAAVALAAVVRRNFALATAYNLVAVSLVFAGVMSPVLAAIFMPVSSISTVMLTAFSLSERSSLWKS